MQTDSLNERRGKMLTPLSSALSARELPFHAVFENSSDGILLIKDQMIIDCNQQALRLLGISNKQVLLFRDPSEISPPTQPNGYSSLLAAKAKLQEALANGQCEFEWVHLRTDGQPFLAEVTLSTFNVGGETWTQAILRDITTHRQLEKNLKLAQFALENATDAVYWIRPDGSIFYVNEAACKMLGYSKSELTQMSVGDLNAEVKGEFWLAHWQTIKSENSELLETTHRARNGEILPVEVSANYINFDNQEYNCAIVRDIRVRKNAEAELRQHTRLLEEAQLAAHMGYYVTDLTTHRWLSSPMLDKIMGIDAQFERTVARWGDMVHPEDRAKAKEEFRLAIERQEHLHHSYRLIRPEDGRTVWVDAWGTIDYEHGQPIRLIGAVMDITTRKEAELELERHRQNLESLVMARTAALAESEQRYRELSASLEEQVRERTAQLAAANTAKSEFLAHMSHEIRTPMNAILGLTQLLENDQLDPKHREFIHEIKESSHSLLNIINDILDFSKIEAGQLRIDSQKFELPPVIERILNLLRPSADNKGLTLTLKMDSTSLGPLLGDPLRLEQILVNLIGNAIKFTEQGLIGVKISAVSTEESLVQLHFEVSDTGIGIAPQVLKHLFQPFRQADASITRRFGGTGLGLAISKRLIESMGGCLGANSTPGQGSTFWFEIPFKRATEVTSVVESEAPGLETQSPQLTGLRILAVDDNRINLFVVERTLQREGAVVTLAADGQQALEILKAQPQGFDVVLMDIQMPVMDGLTATRIIRKDAILKHLPVVALTAGVLDEERKAALEAGVNDFLAKPLDVKIMNDVLRRFHY